MSFNARNLSYESNEPAFLRRIRGEYGDRDSSRYERPLARPRRQVKEGEEDDQPTYVLEESQDTLSKAECEALISAANASTDDEKHVPSFAKLSHDVEEDDSRKDEVAREAVLAKRPVAGIGGSIKRKLAKVIGTEEEGEEASDNLDSGQTSEKIKVKKGKKIKLSFDEESIDP